MVTTNHAIHATNVEMREDRTAIEQAKDVPKVMIPINPTCSATRSVSPVDSTCTMKAIVVAMEIAISRGNAKTKERILLNKAPSKT